MNRNDIKFTCNGMLLQVTIKDCCLFLKLSHHSTRAIMIKDAPNRLRIHRDNTWCRLLMYIAAVSTINNFLFPQIPYYPSKHPQLGPYDDIPSAQYNFGLYLYLVK